MKVFDYIDFIEDHNLPARKSTQNSEIPQKEIISDIRTEPTMDGHVVPAFRNDICVNSKPASAPVSFRASRKLDITATIHAPIASRLGTMFDVWVQLFEKKSNEFFN